MGYTPAEGVAALDYDFNPYADIKGTTPEPSDKQITAYWRGFGRFIRENQRAVDGWVQRVTKVQEQIEAAEDDKGRAEAESARDALDAEYEEWQATNAEESRVTRKALLAAVCSNEPSVEDLDALPGRVFDDFEAYMQEELTPKGRRSGSI